jgi:hypothetical protein
MIGTVVAIGAAAAPVLALTLLAAALVLSWP